MKHLTALTLLVVIMYVSMMEMAFANGFILGVALTAAFFAWRLRIQNDREMESWIGRRVKTLYALGYGLAGVRAHFSKILTVILLAGAAFSFVMIGVTAQQPKVEPKTLNPVASARVIELEMQMALLRDHERDVLDGAGVPRDWNCSVAEKVVTCTPPVVSPSPKKE